MMSILDCWVTVKQAVICLLERRRSGQERSR